MVKKLNNKGFSLVELMVVIALITILSAVAIPNINNYYRNYKYIEYAYSMENLVRWARITAMERSINVGICRSGNTLNIYDMGTSRANPCSGTIISSLVIKDSFVSLTSTNASFDPKGFAILPGNVCITDGSKYNRAVISRFGSIRFEKGTGGCT